MEQEQLMRAAVLDEPGKPVAVEEIPVPTPLPGELLVRVDACGVCHTDLHVMKGDVAFPTPAVLGHEVAGEVVQEYGTGFSVGDAVVTSFIMPCTTCRFCAAGRDDLCESFFAMNRLEGTLYDGTTRLRRADGSPLAMYSMAGLADYAVVPASAAFRRPADLPAATANSMHVACEALGMALPGGAPVLAASPKMLDFARRSGERIVEMVLEDLKPREIMTPGAFRNAAACVLGVSGSINCIKHLQAAAIEAGLELDVYGLFDDLGEKIPVLSAVRPNGDDTIEAFEAAGGARALMKQLEPLLDRTALTVTGRTVADNLADAVVRDAEVIRPIDRPFSDKPPIVILRGSLAPESAIVKLGLRGPDRQTRFSGPAIVYDDGDEAIAGIHNGEVEPGRVLVVRGMGLKGGPGMAGPAPMVVFALDSAGLESDVAFVTDGQLSGLCNKGLTVAEVSPESAVGGPLALVENGDRITIDVDARTLDLDVPETELAVRRARLGEPELPRSRGYLSIYQRSVQPMSTGAVLVKND